MKNSDDPNTSKKILLLTKNIQKIRSISNFLENTGLAVEIATTFEQVQQLASKNYDFIIQIRDFTDSLNSIASRELMQKYFAQSAVYKINDPLLNPKLTEDLLKIAISNIGKPLSLQTHEAPTVQEEESTSLAPIDNEPSEWVPNVPLFPEINNRVEDLNIASKNILFSLQEQIIESDIERNISSNDYLNIAMVKIFDSTHEGCFLMAIPERVEHDVFLKQLDKLKSLFSKNLGSSINIEIVEEKIRKEVYDDLKKTSQKVIEGDFEGQDLLVSFFKMPSDRVNSFETVVKNEMCLVEVQEWWSKVPLPVNAYIFLELNNKKILYIRNGQAVPNDLSARLNAKSHNHLWIEERELHKYKQFHYIMSLPLAL